MQIDKDNEGKENYCVAYECKGSGWEVGFEVCVCPKKDYVKDEMLKITEAKAPATELCCPDSYITENNGQFLTCPYGTRLTDTRICKAYEWEKEQKETKIWTNLSGDEFENVCIGYTMHGQAKSVADEFKKGIVPAKYSCKAPCGGKTPCVR